MGLSRLEITNLRNLTDIRLELSPGFNGFYGLNGSGKSSILEAIHILGRGTSFRTKDLNRVLQTGAERFLVTGRLESPNAIMGVEFDSQTPKFRCDGQNVRSRLDLANRLPLLFISPESHALIAEGPQQRRRFLDWGVFHVEPRFVSVWRRYQRALKQRNKSLGTPGVEEAWDTELVQAGEEITQLRRSYLERLEPYAVRYVQRLVALGDVSFQFLCGWRQDLDFMAALKAAMPQDRQYGFTRQGPHRADIAVKVDGRLARDTVSRGQQKLLVIAMLLAQVALLNAETDQIPAILVDDVAAELDERHRLGLLEVLSELQAQVFLTATEKKALPEASIPIRWFHVEQGRVTSE